MRIYCKKYLILSGINFSQILCFYRQIGYNISKKTNKEVRNLDEKEMKDTVENIFGIELEDGDKEKTIGEEVREILNIKGE